MSKWHRRIHYRNSYFYKLYYAILTKSFGHIPEPGHQDLIKKRKLLFFILGFLSKAFHVTSWWKGILGNLWLHFQSLTTFNSKISNIVIPAGLLNKYNSDFSESSYQNPPSASLQLLLTWKTVETLDLWPALGIGTKKSKFSKMPNLLVMFLINFLLFFFMR